MDPLAIPTATPSPTLTWLLVGVSAFLIGTTKSGLPGSGAVLAVPLVFFVLSAEVATGVLIVLMCVGDAAASSIHIAKKNVVWLEVRSMLGPTSAGLVLGGFIWWGLLVWSASPDVLSAMFNRVIGLIAIAFAVYLIAGEQMRQTTGRLFRENRLVLQLWCVAMGVWAILTNVTGPMLGLMYWGRGLDNDRRLFTGTMAASFLFINALKIPFYSYLHLLTLQSIAFAGCLAPFIGLGVLVGNALLNVISEDQFRFAMCAMSLAMGGLLLANVGAADVVRFFT